MRLIAEFFFPLLWAMSFRLIALFLVARMLWVGLSVALAEIRATLRARGFLARTLLALRRRRLSVDHAMRSA